MASSKALMSAVMARRTFYQIENRCLVPDSRIQELVKDTILSVPSSFNAQSTRIVLLLNNEHRKLWNFTKDILNAVVPEDSQAASEQRINSFGAAYGTMLFFEDTIVIQEFAKNISMYADKFPEWSEHTSAMHQFVLWTALEAEGLGCNLQHYNPLIDKKVQKEWGLPETWTLKAQLVFGKPTGQPGEKAQKGPIEARFKSFGQE